MRQNFDVIIIGGGPAGMSAALWCDELGLDALLLESGPKLGGQLNWTFNPIENYLGVEAANGAELCDKFVKQIEKRRVQIRLNTPVVEIDAKARHVKLGDETKVGYQSLVIASGVRRRKLNVPGEEEFQGKGILFSGKRDRELVRGKTVVVVGGGDAALENVKILSETSAKVILVHRRKEFRARSEFIESVKALSNVRILRNKLVVRIAGTKSIEVVDVRDVTTNGISLLKTEALLVRIGVEPNNHLLIGKSDLDPGGYLTVKGTCETSISTIFAVGDIANPDSPTISSAIGSGASSIKYISTKLISRQI